MEVFEMEQELQELKAVLAAMSEQLRMMNDLILTKDAQIAALTEQVAKLTAQIEELTHKKNSNNSSKPPSEGRLEKPAPKSLRGKSEKKQGGQPRHKGTGMKLDREPDDLMEHVPEKCKSCPQLGQCKMKCCDTRYEYEVQVETKLIAHKSMGCTCPLSGEKLQGDFPAGITGSKQYGAGVFALVNTLLTVGYVSVDRTKQLLSCLRIPISTGAIQNMLDKAAAAAVASVERIKDKVSGKDVVNFDETGLRAAGSLHWLHCACSGPWRFYTVHKKRGEEGMEAMGILPEFTGVAVHDFWSSYKKFKGMLHAMCCQHLERELVFAEEIGNQKWAGKLRKLLQGNSRQDAGRLHRIDACRDSFLQMSRDILFIFRFSVSGFLLGAKIRRVLLYDLLPVRKRWEYALLNDPVLDQLGDGCLIEHFASLYRDHYRLATQISLAPALFQLRICRLLFGDIKRFVSRRV